MSVRVTGSKFIRKPTTAEAIQFDGTQESSDELVKFYILRSPEIAAAAVTRGRPVFFATYDSEIGYVAFGTPTGQREVCTGEWLVFENGKFKVYTDEEFRRCFTDSALAHGDES